MFVFTFVRTEFAYLVSAFNAYTVMAVKVVESIVSDRLLLLINTM